jgi:hypothetical protein
VPKEVGKLLELLNLGETFGVARNLDRGYSLLPPKDIRAAEKTGHRWPLRNASFWCTDTSLAESAAAGLLAQDGDCPCDAMLSPGSERDGWL